MKNFDELLQAYFNQSGHYLAPAEIEYIHTSINNMGVVYTVNVDNICDAKGWETVEINQNDLLVWIYNHE